jgi:DNA polymerase III subunit gamma/tau
MSYQVLARKWRPKSFDTLIGQDHVVRALTNALTQNRLHHAYLFTGTRGVGKTTLARILAKSLNCEAGISATPCGVCNACTEIDRGRFVDLLEVDAASNTQVDAMRELLDNAQYAPTSGRFKVYIIDEVHMLSKSAFNAMLKTLEEPPAHVKFILATTDPQKVPVTVLSRCLQFNLRQMAGTSITTHLQNILTQENIAFEPAALHLISRAAAGSMRDALSLTDQAIAYGQHTVNEAEVRAMLGAIDQSYLYQLLDALLANDGPALIAQAKLMETRSLSFEVALNDFARLLHQIAIAQTVPDSIANDVPEREKLLQLAQKISAETLQLYYQIALLGRRDIGLAPDEYAGFTMSLMRMLSFSPKQHLASTTATYAQNNEIKNIAAPHQPLKNYLNHQNTQQTENTVASIQVDVTDNESVSSVLQRQFNGNWRQLVDELKLGLARQLAQHCELVGYDENSMHLTVPESQKNLLQLNYQEKLSSALASYFDKKIKLSFTVGGTGNTIAKQVHEERTIAQANAVASIETDDFVQALIQDFDAEIVPNSIKPI